MRLLQSRQEQDYDARWMLGGSRSLHGVTRRHVEQLMGVDGDEKGADGRATVAQRKQHTSGHTLDAS